MKQDALLVFVACPPDKARALAQSLVKDRLAACVNILPAVLSVYRWQDKLQNDRESVLMIKTTAARFKALKAAVLKRHPYELPEIIAVKVARGHSPYLEWITHSCE